MLKEISRRDAIEQGAPRYYTGKPCKNGHQAERYTGSCACVECVLEAVRQEREYIKRRRQEVAGGDA